jgi:hypothetical protein
MKGTLIISLFLIFFVRSSAQQVTNTSIKEKSGNFILTKIPIYKSSSNTLKKAIRTEV